MSQRKLIDYIEPSYPDRTRQQERKRVISCAHRHAENGSPMLGVISPEWHGLYQQEYDRVSRVYWMDAIVDTTAAVA